MSPHPDVTGMGVDDGLEARLRAALEGGLAPVVADAGALRTAARTGSRRIRRRRQVVTGLAGAAAIIGVGVFAFPSADGDRPRPLPVATPSVTNTDITNMPSPTSTPSGSPSLSVTSLSPTPSVSTATPTSLPTAITQGGVVVTPPPQGTHIAPPTSRGGGGGGGVRPTTRGVTSTLPPIESWGRFGAYKPGDWLALDTTHSDWTVDTSDSTYTLTGENDGTWASDRVWLWNAGPPHCSRSLFDTTNLAAARFWAWNGPVLGTSIDITQTVSVWKTDAAAVEVMNLIIPLCHDWNTVREQTDTIYIESGTDVIGRSSARGLIRRGPVIIGAYLDDSTASEDDKVDALRDLLDQAASQLAARGTH
ncbi:MAG: hypothetical protein U0Q15_02330 [Kineosporiaceae bacterium]